MTVHDPWIGRQLAGFKIERLLGQGGMASVYFGWDQKLQRPVAIKMIDERYRGDPAYLERFRREAQVIAAWHHPNILQIYSAGEEDGQTFFVMEYIRGRDLRQALDQYARSGRSISSSEVLRIGRAVASALDYAHGRGVIHRDVKPSNIIVAEDGRVVLADFGLALQSTTSTLGQVFGSPHYISPEQARSSARVVPQSDQYSFAVTLYEMLTGTVPFDDPSPTTLALMHINDAPPAPRSINPALSAQVEYVLLKALSKLTHERYPSAHALMDALERAMQSGVVESQPVTMRVLPLPGQDIPAATSPLLCSSLPQSAPLSQAQPLDQTTYSGGGRTTSAGQPTGDGYAGSYPGGAGNWPAPPQARRGSFGRWAACGLVLLALMVLGAGALAFSLPGMPLAAFLRTPTAAQAGQAPPPSATVPPASPTLPPSQTPDMAATQTAAAPPPPTETVPPPLPTLTVTPEPSLTPSPLPPTPTPRTFELILVGREDDSIFVVNTGELPLPVEPFQFGENSRAISGEEWEVSELQPGECIAAWTDGRNPPIPKDLECERVGERVVRTGNRRFWTRSYEVFFNDQPIAGCDTRDEPCIIRFSLP
jgi:serine/threonine protein kinase